MVNGYSKTASFEGEELDNIEVKDAVLKISGKTYNKADDEYVLNWIFNIRRCIGN